MKTNLDQMDRILDELRDIARESGDLTGRLSAEVNNRAALPATPGDKTPEAANGRRG